MKGYMIACYEIECLTPNCDKKDLVFNAQLAERDGWTKIKGRWHCPACSKEHKRTHTEESQCPPTLQ